MQVALTPGMRQLEGNFERAAWQALLTAAVLLPATLAANYEPPGETVQGPDPATMFEVQGRTFWNKSLGLDQQPPGVLGHQCSAARPSPHPKNILTYTPNRRCTPLRLCTGQPSVKGFRKCNLMLSILVL